MTIALHHRLTLPALLLAATGALAQADGPAPSPGPDARTMGAAASSTTRQDVRRQALEQLSHRDAMVVTAGETTGAPLAEVYPGIYAGMTGGRSRAEVAAELREAVRSGTIAPRFYRGNVN